jgi:hypothetical protein
MADDHQDEELVKADLRRQERLESERAPFEGTYRDAEALCDPMAPAGSTAAAASGPSATTISTARRWTGSTGSRPRSAR